MAKKQFPFPPKGKGKPTTKAAPPFGAGAPKPMFGRGGKSKGGK